MVYYGSSYGIFYDILCILQMVFTHHRSRPPESGKHLANTSDTSDTSSGGPVPFVIRWVGPNGPGVTNESLWPATVGLLETNHHPRTPSGIG